MPYKDKENKKEYNKKYRQTHKDEVLAYQKQHYKEHQDEMMAQHEKYYKAHQDEISTYQKQWREAHRNEMSVYEKQWYEQNKDKCNQQAKTWKENHRERNLELIRRQNSKRKRSFGFIPLNKYFEGSEAHHICATFVIYIPKEIHQSIRHSVLRNRNMALINSIAWDLIESRV